MNGRFGDAEIHFGEFSADLNAGELYRNGERVEIQIKPFKVLEVLLRADGAFVSRSRLITLTWGDVHVGQHSLNTAIRKLRLALNDDVDHPRYIETLNGRGYRMVASARKQSHQQSGDLGPDRVKLAVCLFREMPRSDEDMFGQGLVDQIIALLNRMHGNLTVAGPLGRPYRGEERRRSPETVNQSDSDFVLTGSVLRSGPELRVVARLTRTRDSVCIWSDSYLRERKGILAVQEALARQITFAILKSLPTPSSAQTAVDSRSGLYERYLKACFLAGRMSEEGFAKGVDLLNGILLEDQSYHPAYAALCLILPTASLFGFLPPDQIFERTRDVATKAHELMPGTAEPHIAIGMTNLFYEGDIQASESALEQAVGINPLLCHTHISNGVFLTARGRFEDAFHSIHRALEIDPLSLAAHLALASAYYMNGRFDDALMRVKAIHELDPYLPVGHALGGLVWSRMGHDDRGVESCRKAVSLSPESSFMKAHLGLALARSRWKGEAAQLLRELIDIHNDGSWNSAYWIALIYSELGDVEAALEWFESACEERDPWRVFAQVDPRLSSVHHNARFRALTSGRASRVSPSAGFSVGRLA